MNVRRLSPSILPVLLATSLAGCIPASWGQAPAVEAPVQAPAEIWDVRGFELKDDAMQSRGAIELRASLYPLRPEGANVQLKILKGGAEFTSLAMTPEENGSVYAEYGAVFTPSVPGEFTLVVVVNGKPLHTEYLMVANVPAWGGGRAKVAKFAMPAYVGYFGDSASFTMRDWIADDDDSAYMIEWFKDGQRVETKGDFRAVLRNRAYGATNTEFVPSHQKFGAGTPLPAWSYREIAMRAPSSFTEGPGHWEIRVHRENLPSRRFVLDVSTEAEHGDFRVVPTTKRENCWRLGSSNFVEPTSCAAALLDSTEFAPDASVQAALAAVPHEKRSPNATGIGVTAEQARAFARSTEAWKLRSEIDEAQASGMRAAQDRPELEQGENESPMAFYNRKQAAKRGYEASIGSAHRSGSARAAQLWVKLKPLVPKFGGPWTPSEHPFATRF